MSDNLNLSDPSHCHRIVHNFIQHNNNYMRIPYATEVRLREFLLWNVERGGIPEEEFWEVLTDICPAFCDYMS